MNNDFAWQAGDLTCTLMETRARTIGFEPLRPPGAASAPLRTVLRLLWCPRVRSLPFVLQALGCEILRDP